MKKVFKGGSLRHIALTIKKCSKCGKERKFLTGSERDIQDICGECFDWESEKVQMYLTKQQKAKLDKLLSEN